MINLIGDASYCRALSEIQSSESFTVGISRNRLKLHGDKNYYWINSDFVTIENAEYLLRGILYGRKTNDPFLLNCRAIPGYMGLYRSAKLNLEEENTYSRLHELGIFTIIDFSGKSLSQKAKSLIKTHLIGYYSVALYNRQLFDYEIAISPDITSQSYLTLIENKENLANVFLPLSKAKSKTLICCKYGRDRTGVFSALLEMIKGASLVDMTIDYCSSFEGLSEYYQTHPAKDALHERARYPLATQFRKFIETFQKKYQSVENFLFQHQLTKIINL